eukprot:2057706-Prymnesium_polylepis.1
MPPPRHRLRQPVPPRRPLRRVLAQRAERSTLAAVAPYAHAAPNHAALVRQALPAVERCAPAQAAPPRCATAQPHQ